MMPAARSWSVDLGVSMGEVLDTDLVGLVDQARKMASWLWPEEDWTDASKVLRYALNTQLSVFAALLDERARRG